MRRNIDHPNPLAFNGRQDRTPRFVVRNILDIDLLDVALVRRVVKPVVVQGMQFCENPAISPTLRQASSRFC
jgi:hypothetical protein